MAEPASTRKRFWLIFFKDSLGNRNLVVIFALDQNIFDFLTQAAGCVNRSEPEGIDIL
jgi:hypothetical protein